MAKLVTLQEHHLDRLPSIVVIQDTIWWEVQLAHVKIQEHGLRVHLPVIVCTVGILCMHIHTLRSSVNLVALHFVIAKTITRVQLALSYSYKAEVYVSFAHTKNGLCPLPIYTKRKADI